jgi:hypothetical protein
MQNMRSATQKLSPSPEFIDKRRSPRRRTLGEELGRFH